VLERMYGEEQPWQAEGDLRLPPLHRDSLLLPLQLLRPYWEDKMGFLSSPAAAPQIQQQPLEPETPNVPTDSLEGEARDTRTIADIRRATEEANVASAGTLVTEDDKKTLLGT
jgi:hypothetical protein